ncbi:matrix metalloproteinase-9-like [Hermetia illucens]|uniref:matrix metalloproteinase-9-like n=1 Tax=Hermetia illucens TaxID=343691 RepID=UPI0018CBF961|nr:matrix metalloproteinase-9-like [Hermetia illucens]
MNWVLIFILVVIYTLAATNATPLIEGSETLIKTPSSACRGGRPGRRQTTTTSTARPNAGPPATVANTPGAQPTVRTTLPPTLPPAATRQAPVTIAPDSEFI